MKPLKIKRHCLLILLLGLMILIGSLDAFPYQIDWFTIDSGGGYSSTSGSEYSLLGTIGQTDTGISSGGSYSITGGFWADQTSTQPPQVKDIWMLY